MTIVACHGKTLANGACAAFGASGGTIGRDADNTLILPDDGGTVARHHVAVRAYTDGWQLLNTSEHAAITINGEMLAPGAQTSLHAGDIVNIGAYVLQTAASALPPAWDLPMRAGPAEAPYVVTLPLAAGDSNPLRMDALAAGHSVNPPSETGPSTSLHDLLDTPVDPLALFGASDRTWSGSDWNGSACNESAASGLFADLLTTPAADGFGAQRPDNVAGYAIRDDVPEFGGHLRLKLALPPEAPESPTLTEEAVVAAAASPVAPSPSLRASCDEQVDYRNVAGKSNYAPANVIRIAAPAYGAKLHMKTAMAHNGPITVEEPAQPEVHPALISAVDTPLEARIMLVQAFLDGAGVTPDAAAGAGVTPEFMRTLGMLVRALKQQVT
ncbi:FHA domain-containing protein [Paraburkholderia sediminicola]|uniref:FHA domain-containing protein n=1 Tax=Paraburkholderia sediminicola TaxID=458836 RepID=UPI0038B9D5AC